MGQSFIYFEYTRYINDLKSEIAKEAEEIEYMFEKQIIRNIEDIHFKTNRVKIRSIGKKASYTSDEERKVYLIRSVDGLVRKEINGYIKIHLMSMREYFEDTHIGLYYEHGTGEFADGTSSDVDLYSYGNAAWNPFREGKKIVSRSKYIDYVGLGKGIWVDIGGNERITGSKRGGERTAEFISYVGEDIHAYHWFSRAIKDRRGDMIKMLRSAIKRVNIGNYIKMKKKFVLGGDN